ncbi:MAG: acetate kinase [Pirellulaceae bacterium]|nr:MAG: acetate kinase [Pirellulaceae bacterium]
MKILVANLGSTSFKYRLFDMGTPAVDAPRQLARGSVERIGADVSPCRVEIGDQVSQLEMAVPHHGVAVEACLQQLTDPEHGCLKSADEVAGIGFKAVHGGRLSGVYRVTEEVLQAMEEVAEVAPAHNPPYIAAMRQLAQTVPQIPLVAAFETDFHRTIPEPRRRYAIPHPWAEELPIRKWGFHGASHRYIAERSAQLMGREDARVISLHLGGSSSLCAIAAGQSVATTMGMSPQSGVPQNNRVGDFDPFTLPLIMRHTGLSLEQVLHELGTSGGLLGLSAGAGRDLRDLQQAAAAGNDAARLAIDVYVEEIRRHLGGMLVALGGGDALVFTGGIGENAADIRAAVCRGLEQLGIVLDEQRNSQVRAAEARIDAQRAGAVEIWVIPTNEELIVARQTAQVLASTR